MVGRTKAEISEANRRRYEELRAAGQEAAPKAKSKAKSKTKPKSAKAEAKSAEPANAPSSVQTTWGIGLVWEKS